ncbi:helix-turn-helix domain-containing protein [Hoeflea sp. CAU 1731]
MTDKCTTIDKTALQDFTSRKLDLIDAITCDADLSDTAKLVGIRILQHVNHETGLANPSEERIAAQLKKSPDTVKRAVRELKKHWVSCGRPDRQRSNVYRFLKNRINHVIDATIIREEEARERSIRKQKARYDRAKMPPQDCADRANDAVFDRANTTQSDRAKMPPKHLHKNYLYGTPMESQLMKEVVVLGQRAVPEPFKDTDTDQSETDDPQETNSYKMMSGGS